MLISTRIILLKHLILDLLERLASTFPIKKDQIVFYINNFACILSIFQEHNLACEEIEHFEGYLMQQKELFAEEEITFSFPQLVSFVTKV